MITTQNNNYKCISSFLPTISSESKQLSTKQISAATYSDGDYTLPLHLVKAAHPIKEMLLKRNKRGLRRVFEQIGYMCLFSEERNCFMKQATLGEGCGNFGEKTLCRKQVGRLENKLVGLKLYKRRQPRSDFSFDRHLDPLGVAVYLLLTGRVKYRPIEKMSQPKQKNVPAQFIRQRENIYINTTSSDSKNFVGKAEKSNSFALRFQKEKGINLVNISKMYRFDIIDPLEAKKNEKIAVSSFAQMRKML